MVSFWELGSCLDITAAAAAKSLQSCPTLREPPEDPATPQLGISQKRTKTLLGKDTGTPVFKTALLTQPGYGDNLSVRQQTKGERRCAVSVHAHTPHTNDGPLLSFEKERNPAICNNMDGPWRYYATRNESERNTNTARSSVQFSCSTKNITKQNQKSS